MQLYPGWSARDNYATRTKKKKIKRDVTGMTSNYETKLGIHLLTGILRIYCAVVIIAALWVLPVRPSVRLTVYPVPAPNS